MRTLLLVLIAITQIARTGIEGFVAKAGALGLEALTNARVEILDGPSSQTVRTDGGGRSRSPASRSWQLSSAGYQGSSHPPGVWTH